MLLFSASGIVAVLGVENIVFESCARDERMAETRFCASASGLPVDEVSLNFSISFVELRFPASFSPSLFDSSDMNLLVDRFDFTSGLDSSCDPR